MNAIYFESDSIVKIRVSEKLTAREALQDWHTHMGYAEDGSIVEIVLLGAMKVGFLPLS